MNKNDWKTEEIISLKQVKATKILPFKAVKSSVDVANFLKEEIGSETQELLVLMCLNTAHEVVSYSIVNRGTANQSIAHIRDIVQRIYLSNSTSFLISHNHPTNYTIHSKADKIFTEKLQTIANISGLQFVDHIIVGTDNYYSFAEEGEI